MQRIVTEQRLVNQGRRSMKGERAKSLPKRRFYSGTALFLVGIGLATFSIFWIDSGLNNRVDREVEHARRINLAGTVDGTILSSTLERSCDSEDSSSNRWVLEVEFAYEAHGVQYSGAQKWRVGSATCPPRSLFGTREGDLSNAEQSAILAEYAVGKPIVVHYDRSDPGRAWVGPAPKFRDAWWALGILFGAVGVLTIGGGFAAMGGAVSRRAHGDPAMIRKSVVVSPNCRRVAPSMMVVADPAPLIVRSSVMSMSPVAAASSPTPAREKV